MPSSGRALPIVRPEAGRLETAADIALLGRARRRARIKRRAALRATIHLLLVEFVSRLLRWTRSLLLRRRRARVESSLVVLRWRRWATMLLALIEAAAIVFIHSLLLLLLLRWRIAALLLLRRRLGLRLSLRSACGFDRALIDGILELQLRFMQIHTTLHGRLLLGLIWSSLNDWRRHRSIGDVRGIINSFQHLLWAAMCECGHTLG